MPADRLEIVVPTYGRAPQLRRTLEQFAVSPFAECRLTIVDNASPDDTRGVYEALRESFRDLRYVRNPHNIGGPANVLRAIELAEAPYCWLVADDDEWDFSHCEDVLEALQSGRADLISVGAPGRDGWPAGLARLRELDARGLRIPWVFTFLPNTIFRTALADEATIAEGYALAGTLYPQIALLKRALDDDATVHVSERELVVREGITATGTSLWWYVRWLRACAALEGQVRPYWALAHHRTALAWFGWLAFIVAGERVSHPHRVRRDLAEVILRLPLRLRIAALACVVFTLLPPATYRPAMAVRDRLARRRGGGAG